MEKKNLTKIKYNCLYNFRNCEKNKFLLYPIIPQSSLKALKYFNINEKDLDFSSLKIIFNLKSNEFK